VSAVDPAVGSAAVRQALRRAADVLEREAGTLAQLDRAIGDGDLGITAEKMAVAIREHADTEVGDDLGRYLIAGGMAVNRAAPSTFGTLAATAMMRAGKVASGKGASGQDGLEPATLAEMLQGAETGIEERGKAQLGDKTVLDALHPAAQAFAREIEAGRDLSAAARAMRDAARQGMNDVTNARSRQGRAGWIGERTEGKVDPGCHLLVAVFDGWVSTPRD